MEVTNDPNQQTAVSGHGEQFHTTPAEAAGCLPEKPSVSEEDLREHAQQLVESWESMPSSKGYTGLEVRLKELAAKLKGLLAQAKARVHGKALTPELELLESTRMLEAAIVSTTSAAEAFRSLPHVHQHHTKTLPRVTSLAEAYLWRCGGIWSAQSLSLYVHEVQRTRPLELDEVLLLPQALKLAQLEFLLDRAEEAFADGPMPPIEQSPFSAPLHSMRRLNQYEWRGLLESLIPFHAVLRDDPAGAFAAMDDETRHSYYLAVAQLARYADFDELQTAQTALELAREAQRVSEIDPRRSLRTQHIGFYLIAEGVLELKLRIGYHAPAADRLRTWLRRHNEDVYILSVMVLALLLIIVIIAPLVPTHAFWPLMGALLLTIFPVTQGAVELVNALVLSVFKAEALPKMDYSEGLPADASTLVVVPTLLLREGQVQELFEDLEARYLSNEDPHLHFAILSDLPDTASLPSADERDPLVQLALNLTENLNAKYANGRGGHFLFLHRHRVFNARQGVWMGWERKRGKLLDLNKLLLHAFDSFPIKSGPLHVLEGVRYVITLDSDTQLPRATAARLVGTMTHPLNRAIVDPRSRVVTAGYGILQPRVGVSVSSASRSRLAAIYSGETGFDIYTRAVSDVYQDLFGEGIFTGKGIYDVKVLHDVLDRRFPRNALLSHDLIEGAYVRAGLVTDVEVIDDYPSQHHAHARRRHRWIRGDWQILRWLFGRVPDESGKLVPNPVSFISQWKIFDNLRRSLIEPFTFILLVLGWFVLPGGARYWTLVTVLLLLLPALVQLVIDFGKAVAGLSFAATRSALTRFASSFAFALINLTFLAHQMMLSVDAIVRTLIRSLYSGQRLLEWETAAQSESSHSRNSLDIYLYLSPALALLLGVVLARQDRHALWFAGPILVLWIVAPLVATWLSSSPRQLAGPLTAEDQSFLREHALLLWRFYADFGGPENRWLIPDNVEERELLQVRKLSPTNLGMLLNARQAACELGFLTVPEFVEASLGTLATYDLLEKHRGHIFNWYDIETIKAVPPLTISTVDSGNLAASFYTLHAGCLDLLKHPLLTPDSFAALDPLGRNSALTLDQALDWLFDERTAPSAGPTQFWPDAERFRRREALRTTVEHYLPWLLPEYAQLRSLHPALGSQLPTIEHLDERLREVSAALSSTSPATSAQAQSLAARLPLATEHVLQLQRDLKTLIDRSEHFAESMQYGFLFVPERQLLSIGFDGEKHELHSACYDLLASEARIASFLAVAKGDIPQQAWFRLDRSHVLVRGRATLLSWTGTMFEYMMPALWMRSFPNTLLVNALESVVRIQRAHVRGIPWGISESGFATTDAAGRYGYQAWGIPKVALKYGAEDGPVISPYSTFLALPLLRKEGLANLRRMAALGWTGAYGFYEAADYTGNPREPQLVRSWMAHHQGMALLAVTNLLRANIFHTWFHANPRVRAAELLLHEKALSKETLEALSEVGEPKAA